MKKLTMIAASLLACAVLAQEAEPKEGPRDGRRGPMMHERGGMRPGFGGGMMGMNDPAVMAVMRPQIAEKIGLSAEVQAQIKKLEGDFRQSVGALQKKTRAAMEKQAQLMQAAKIDEAAVMAAIDELFDLRKEMAKAQTKRVIAVKALLTPEQLEKALAEMKKEREERRGRMGKGRRPHRSPESRGEGAKDAPPPPPPEAK